MAPSLRSRPGSIAALAAVAVLSAAGVAGCGGQDPFAIRRGSPDAGFPLRGDLRDDTSVLRDAGRAWFDDDRDHDGDVFRGRRDATALWAGKVGGRDTVVLAHRGDAALVHRTDDGWDVSASTAYGTELSPRLAAFPQAVLTADRAPGEYRTATPEGLPVGMRDGLWATSDAQGPAQLPEGVLVLADGVDDHPATGSGPGLVVTGFALTGNRSPLATATPALGRRILAVDGPADQPFLQRVVAASVVATDRPPAEAGIPRMELVEDAAQPGIGAVTVVSTTWSGRRGTVSAGIGGATASGSRATIARLEDQRAADSTLRGRDGPALGSAVVIRGTGPDAAARLLIAGDRRIVRIEILRGTRRTVRPGPVAAFPVPVRGTGDGPTATDGDTAITGRTAAGAIVLPAPRPPGVVRLDGP